MAYTVRLAQQIIESVADGVLSLVRDHTNSITERLDAVEQRLDAVESRRIPGPRKTASTRPTSGESGDS